MGKIVMIGSMQHPELFERARLAYPGDEVHWPVENDPTNELIGDWHSHVDSADVLCVVRKSDGSLGRGTVDELKHAVGSLQGPVRSKPLVIEWACEENHLGWPADRT